jgi:hypothetical protein
MPAAWELLLPEGAGEKLLAILIPHTGTVSSEWAIKFRDFKVPIGSKIFFSRGLPIDVTRENMVNDVLKEGFEWLFFWDSDVILPDNVLAELFSHEYPFISGMYKAKKHTGFFWDVWRKIVTPEGKTAFAPIATWDQRVVEADVVGCGCMLVHRSVFEKIREIYPHLPFFFWARERAPRVLDSMGIPDPMMRDVGEDFWFCLLAKRCGFNVLVDTNMKCKHITTIAIDEKITLPGV